ncbi:NAD-dependent epimerase/dehydratase family protein [Acinetobacter colistiniresistens]|uniref:NAD-dependent epimerase/dehydratase family protein n=1 Tax=Acinetobacter colistiniresistens TaxID=280145 RepID=UPI000DD004C9|nr:NAD(P)-dependent oxidoreductase [Acinetobacter colistiniresistens]
MNILITGSSGNLGTALSIVCKEKGYSVIGVDIRESTETTHVGNIHDEDFINSCMTGIDVVFHTAGLHKPHVATHSIHEFIETNIWGTCVLLQSAKDKKVKSFIFSSTTSVYGSVLSPDQSLPAVWINESTKIESKNIYGLTKLSAEELCRLFSLDKKMRCIVLRNSRFFYEDDDNKFIRENYNQDNIKVNELLYRRADIEDVVNAHLKAAFHYNGDEYFDKFIISSTTPFVKDDCKVLNCNPLKIINKIYPGCSYIYKDKGWRLFPRFDRVYDNTKARKLLEWEPKYTFSYVLDCLKEGKPFKSNLAERVGWIQYHDSTFTNMPYPVYEGNSISRIRRDKETIVLK